MIVGTNFSTTIKGNKVNRLFYENSSNNNTFKLDGKLLQLILIVNSTLNFVVPQNHQKAKIGVFF